MIARISYYVIIVILLSSAYLDWQSWRMKRWWWRLIGWLLALTGIAMTIDLVGEQDYFPSDISRIENYMYMLFLYAIPLSLVALSSAIGLFFKRQKRGLVVGWILAVLTALVYVYGSTVGFRQFEVTRLELAFPDLPDAFDGYRIVQFSDAHVGTYTGERQALLRRAVDSINAQQADLIVFTGDLQNMYSQEIEPHKELLSSLKAPDGVLTIMGNHDYADYTHLTGNAKLDEEELTRIRQARLGWTMLTNNHHVLYRGTDSLVIAGMENEGGGRFPVRADVQLALWGVGRDAFVVMLEHDPKSWRARILPQCHAQLTLSGHTHAMQFEILGWSPIALTRREYDGLYEIGHRKLYVSRGLGGVIPFRFGATGHITVITLRKGS